MTEAGSLHESRLRIRQQLLRAAEIDRRRQRLDADYPETHAGLTLRCTKKHPGGKSPKVAEVHATAYGTFFASTLPWAKSDATTLRPWVEETHLASLYRDGSLDLDDDQLLRSAIENVEWLRQHGPGDRSWIATRAQRAHRIREILDLPYTEGRLSLWTRCPSHLEDFEAVDPTHLLRALR